MNSMDVLRYGHQTVVRTLDGLTTIGLARRARVACGRSRTLSLIWPHEVVLGEVLES